VPWRCGGEDSAGGEEESGTGGEEVSGNAESTGAPAEDPRGLELVESDRADDDEEEAAVSADEGVEDLGVPDAADEDRADAVHARGTGSISDLDVDPPVESVRASGGATPGSAPLLSFCAKLDAVRKYGSFDIFLHRFASNLNL